jgi:hypothetical protein
MVLTREKRNSKPERITGSQKSIDVGHEARSQKQKTNVQEEQVNEKNPGRSYCCDGKYHGHDKPRPQV